MSIKRSRGGEGRGGSLMRRTHPKDPGHPYPRSSIADPLQISANQHKEIIGEYEHARL